MDYYQKSLEEHKKRGGKIEIKSKFPVSNKEELSVAYTPGVSEPCQAIAKNPALAKDLVATKKMVAVVTDGSAVLGLGNIGAEASLPVMEGKAILFKEFGGVDAFPIAINTQDTEEFIKTVKNIAPTFGGINLEDISAPRCFEIEERLKRELDIPVFHDDQHGTAIVVLAGLINSLKIVKKDKSVKIVVNGAGSAGVAITKLLHKYGFGNIIVCDSKGAISKEREGLNNTKKELLKFTNLENVSGNLKEAIKNADVFIGVSKGDLLKAEDIETMNKDSIIFAMANPTPEIMPEEAKKGGARIVATGRSDYPNQLNNVLVFPGIFKGALENGVKDVTDDIKIAVAENLATAVDEKELDEEKIIPDPFDERVVEVVSKATNLSKYDKRYFLIHDQGL
ncbi:NADP-dependent malic enzyme [Patescibacteria group bacterium]